jgi:hypothetical protein
MLKYAKSLNLCKDKEEPLANSSFQEKIRLLYDSEHLHEYFINIYHCLVSQEHPPYNPGMNRSKHR